MEAYRDKGDVLLAVKPCTCGTNHKDFLRHALFCPVLADGVRKVKERAQEYVKAGKNALEHFGEGPRENGQCFVCGKELGPGGEICGDCENS